MKLQKGSTSPSREALRPGRRPSRQTGSAGAVVTVDNLRVCAHVTIAPQLSGLQASATQPAQKEQRWVRDSGGGKGGQIGRELEQMAQVRYSQLQSGPQCYYFSTSAMTAFCGKSKELKAFLRISFPL